MCKVYWYVSLSAIPWVHLPTHGIARRLIRQSKGAGIFSESILLLAEAKKNFRTPTAGASPHALSKLRVSPLRASENFSCDWCHYYWPLILTSCNYLAGGGQNNVRKKKIRNRDLLFYCWYIKTRTLWLKMRPSLLIRAVCPEDCTWCQKPLSFFATDQTQTPVVLGPSPLS